MKTKRPTPLTLFFFGVVAAYHACNWIFLSPEAAKIPSRWGRKTLTVDLHGKNLVSWAVPTGPVTRDAELIQRAGTLFLSRVGGFLRYEGGEIGAGCFLGERSPYVRSYLFDELPFQYGRTKDEIHDGYIEQLEDLKSYFAGKGVTLLFLPVPTKISVERGRIPGRLPHVPLELLPDERREAAPNIVEELVRAFPEETIDTQSIYGRYLLDHPAADLYKPMDVHWSSLGSALAASGIIDKLHEKDRGLAAAELVPDGPAPLPNDDPRELWDAFWGLSLPHFLITYSPPFQWREPLYRLKPVTSAPPSGRVVLVGSSYGAQKKGTPYDLAAVLGAALNRPHLNMARDASHTIHAVRELADSGFQLRRGDLFVLEFVVRTPWWPGARFAHVQVVEGPGRPVRELNARPN